MFSVQTVKKKKKVGGGGECGSKYASSNAHHECLSTFQVGFSS